MENIMKPEPHKIVSVIRQTAAEFTIRVACDKDPGYGQFFQLSLPKIGEAPISVCGKGPGYVEFTIRKVGRLTGGVFDLKAGDTLFMRGPYGNAFPVDQFENKDLLVICGGTGMSPVKTTLTHFYDHPEICKSVYLIAGFKDINCVGILRRDVLPGARLPVHPRRLRGGARRRHRRCDHALRTQMAPVNRKFHAERPAPVRGQAFPLWLWMS